jgi:RHS repeat-associated protein
MTYYYWDFDTDNVFLEEDENGDTIAEYTHEPGLYGELIGQERDGQVRYYNFDGQGSTRELTDENGDVTDTYTYTAFGEEIAHTGTTENPFRYNGALGYYTNSDTNDIYVRERIYEPTNGRWLSEDPEEFSDGPNQYVYVLNDPLNFDDPSGLALQITPTTPRRLNPSCRRISAAAAWWFRVAPWPCRSNLGFFIQRVTVHCMICDCVNTNPCYHDSFQYWEAWPVHKPNTPRRERLPNVPATLRVKDTSAFSTSSPLGSYRQSGLVRFYCVAPRGQARQAGELDPMRCPSNQRDRYLPAHARQARGL